MKEQKRDGSKMKHKVTRRRRRRSRLEKKFRRYIKKIGRARLCIVGLMLSLLVFVLVGVRLLKHTATGEDYPKESGESVPASTAVSVPDDQTDSVRQAAAAAERQKLVEQADRLAASYDYDGAIALLKSSQGYESDVQLQEKAADYETTRDACELVNIEDVTHVFYHSLVVDPQRAFANQDTDRQARGNNQWMTTISEFEKITQEMYDRGYVLVSIHDLVQETTDENGNTVYRPGTILLPPGKKAFVLSVDDVSYYHGYDGYGYASKMVLDADGKPVCEYIDAQGNVLVGDYDVVPILDKFIEEHPDASYKGAKGLIALTGYNGILGYRTDFTYLEPDGSLTDSTQRKWLSEHPDFDIEAEKAQAKQVADAMKADGWEFASHTWGHMKVGEASLERIQVDTQRWRENVEPLIGPTDVIVFAHGQDLGQWGAYDASNEKYQYLRGQGYRIFCNVDASSPYKVWLESDYLRMGRRNLDGYRIYKNAIGAQDSLSDLFDAAAIMDPERPPVPEL